MKIISFCLFFALCFASQLQAQFPSKNNYGIVLNQTALRSQPRENASVIANLPSETSVYAINYNEANIEEEHWVVVKTGNEQMGYVLSEDIGIYTGKNLLGSLVINNEPYDCYLTYSKAAYDDELITPILWRKNNKAVFLIKPFDGKSQDMLRGQELSSNFIQFGEQESPTVNWSFQIKNNSLAVSCEYFNTETFETEESNFAYNFGLVDNKIYAVHSISEGEYKMADSYAFVVAKTKIPVYADAYSKTIKTYLNSWETAAISSSDDNNCKTKILLKNGQIGYINYAYHCSEDNNLLFFNSEDDNTVQIKDKTYQLVTASKIDMSMEGVYLMVLLVESGSWGKAKPIVSTAPASQNDLYASRFIEYSFYEDGGSSLILDHSIQENKMRLFLIWGDPEEEGRGLYFYQFREESGEMYAEELYNLSKEISFPTQY